MKLWLLLLPALLVGCPATATDDDDSAAGDDDDAVPDFVEGTVILRGATGAENVEGLEVTWGEETVETDANGHARFTLPSQTDFAFVAVGADIQTTWVEGNSGTSDFQFITFVGAVSLHDDVVDALGLPPRDPTRGTLVVAMDTAALQAATGASATLDVDSDDAFVFVNGQPVLGNELVFQADGFVTFANVAAGPATINITPPDENFCLSFPALSGTDNHTTYEVHADAVTTAQFICQ
jgi:hypothetical protein